MSGRFAFTAGNTLTAAQLNTNIMDGIPYKIQTGTGNTTTTAGTPWSTGTFAVTLTGFTQTPIVTATCSTNSGNQLVAQVSGLSSAGFTVRVSIYSNVATSLSAHWHAIQATPSSGSGS